MVRARAATVTVATEIRAITAELLPNTTARVITVIITITTVHSAEANTVTKAIRAGMAGTRKRDTAEADTARAVIRTATTPTLIIPRAITRHAVITATKIVITGAAITVAGGVTTAAGGIESAMRFRPGSKETKAMNTAPMSTGAIGRAIAAGDRKTIPVRTTGSERTSTTGSRTAIIWMPPT
jgi:hypothetical protein